MKLLEDGGSSEAVKKVRARRNRLVKGKRVRVRQLGRTGHGVWVASRPQIHRTLHRLHSALSYRRQDGYSLLHIYGTVPHPPERALYGAEIHVGREGVEISPWGGDMSLHWL